MFVFSDSSLMVDDKDVLTDVKETVGPRNLHDVQPAYNMTINSNSKVTMEESIQVCDSYAAIYRIILDFSSLFTELAV